MDSFFICSYNGGMADVEKTGQSLSPEQEIKELEQKLEAKKRELSAGGAPSAEGVPPEKEVFREVMREHTEGMKPAAPSEEPALIPQLSVTHAPPADAQKKADDDDKKKKREEELQALVTYAFAHSIQSAVEKARAESPYLLDALHDRLADEYYEKMVALRKLKSL